MAENFDPYYKWLAIPPQEQPPNLYRLLGVPVFTSDPEVLENAADQRMAHIRSAQVGQRSLLSQRILNELSAARGCLLDPDQKRLYDQQLRAEMIPAAGPDVIAVSPAPAVDRRHEGSVDSRAVSRVVIVISSATAGLLILFLIWRAVVSETGAFPAKTSDGPTAITPPKKSSAQTSSPTATNEAAKKAKAIAQPPVIPAIPNGLARQVFDWTTPTHQFPMGPTFDAGKDWLVSTEARIPSLEPGFLLYVIWGDDRGGFDPLSLFLQNDNFQGCVDDCRTNVRHSVQAKLSPEIVGRWTKLTYVFRSQQSTLQLFINDRLVAESVCKFQPNADRIMPIHVGSSGEPQQYRGQLRSLVISNFP